MMKGGSSEGLVMSCLMLEIRDLGHYVHYLPQSVLQFKGARRIIGSIHIQSTLVISNLKGPSETLRDTHTSTYQIFRIEENTNRTTKFNK